MNEKDLEKLFASMDVPAPDPERRKETLNLAAAAFEAQKSAILEKNQETPQGSSWLSRLIRQATSERKDNMSTSNKKLVYGGLFGGLATACVALLVYGGGALQPEKESVGSSNLTEIVGNMEASDSLLGKKPSSRDAAAPVGQLAQAPQTDNLERWRRMQPAPQERIMEAPGSSDMAATMQAAPESSPPMAAKIANSANLAAGGAPSFSPVARMAMPMDAYAPMMENEGRDRFSHEEQNSVLQVKAQPVSTFSIDVDTASYAFVRQTLDQGVLPQKDAVRIEEMVNYFDYAYPGPSSAEEPFKTSVVLTPSPWNEGKQLMTIGIKGYDVQKLQAPDSNIVFLIDTSGSMNEPKKLPLLKQSLSLLLDTLKPTDKVSIVVYAGSAGTVLQPTPVSDKGTILQALQTLSAGGSTSGGEGIRLAYQQAQANFNEKAVNRVILATDGDFNVGITDPDELQGFVEREREKGIFLSVLGFGQGNYNDELMQKLAQNGNGVAAYIDTLNEARKVLVQEAGATLFPIAKDVKIQVEFNPATVSEYRLVGYETRALKTEDFNNDKVDAGDIGAGAEVSAIYEITPAGSTPVIDESRYAPKVEKPVSGTSGELAFVKVRYKLPKESVSKLITTPVNAAQQTADPVLLREANWAQAVAGFAQLLKGGTFTGALTYDDVLKQAQASKGEDPFGYRAEFITLIYKAKTAASLASQPQGQGGGELYR